MKKGNSLEELEKQHGGAKISELQRQLAIERRRVARFTAGEEASYCVKKTSGNTFSFGLIGDWHVGNYDFNRAALKEYFKYAKGQGIDTFYHTGDLIDGHRVYKGQEFEVQDVGIARQVKRCLEIDVPGDLHFITGNHDASFKNLAGCDVGKAIENERDNWHFLGEDQADVVYNTSHGEYVLRLLHPGGGSAYAVSYKSQKIIESLEGGSKPNLIAIGHFHKAEMMPSYRNVTIIQTGTFENQTPFMVRRGLAAHVGGWLVEVTVNERLNIIRPEFVAFY